MNTESELIWESYIRSSMSQKENLQKFKNMLLIALDYLPRKYRNEVSKYKKILQAPDASYRDVYSVAYGLAGIFNSAINTPKLPKHLADDISTMSNRFTPW